MSLMRRFVFASLVASAQGVQLVSRVPLAVRLLRTCSPRMAVSEDEAKRAWLRKLDAPTWGKVGAALSEVVGQAIEIAALEERCETGEIEACNTLKSEHEAKKAWLAKLDVPAWGCGGTDCYIIGKRCHAIICHDGGCG